MSSYPSIYATVVFDLHPKIKAYMDQLNRDGQIDLDQSGHPYLVKCEKQGPNFFTQISRNNRLENFVLNPRKRQPPVCSWNHEDGFQRPQHKQVVVMADPSGATKNRERERRKVTSEAIENMVDTIMEMEITTTMNIAESE